MVNVLKKIGKYTGYFFLILLFLILLPYLFCPIYRFPKPQPFTGNYWFNPYENLNGNWYKANFQVQSLCWFGITAGHDKTEDIYNHYKKLGYDVITISDYQYINTFKDMNIDYLPVYEHGYNLRKRHQVLIGAKKVLWRDYLLWQSIHNKQHILKLLKKQADFTAIVHPKFMKGYQPSDMAYLTDYNSIEVLNHYRRSEKHWDAALSAGRAVWILGDDDSHDINNPKETGVYWTMINARSVDNQDIVNALQEGKAYGVKGKNAENRIKIKEVKVVDNHLSILCDTLATEVCFIGQDGEILTTVTNTDSATIELQSAYHYVRTKITLNKTRLYLNPVVRYNGNSLSVYSAEVNQVKTWTKRLLIIIIFSGIIWVVQRLRKRNHPE